MSKCIRLSCQLYLVFSSLPLLVRAEWTKVCFQGVNPLLKTHTRKFSSSLYMTPMQALKPAAVPLLEGGKALARYGELMIDLSTTTTSYMGFSWKAFQMNGDDNGDTEVTKTLSPHIAAIGACIRTAGDCIAQAAALMRFKTGHESVVVELRDASNCFCNQLENNSLNVNGDNGNNRMGASSAWAKAEEALSDLSDLTKNPKVDTVEWNQAKAMLGMYALSIV